MKHILAIDIGNTNITLGLFRGARLVAKGKMATHEPAAYMRRLRAFLRADKRCVLDCAMISSVVPDALRELEPVVKRLVKCQVIVAGRDRAIPIKNMYRNKREVGCDRLVNAYAASVLYGVPAIVIDLGTAVTFDIVSKRREYLGGLILPGIELSLRSLYEHTALLPRVELKRVTGIIGKDTVSSMRAGILYGFGAMCDELSLKFRKEIGARAVIIATGGNARLIKSYASSVKFVDEDLTLKGLFSLAVSG